MRKYLPSLHSVAMLLVLVVVPILSKSGCAD